MSKLNPFHRRVGDASIRESESLIEFSVDGGTPEIAGELNAFESAEQTQEFSTAVLGGGGYTDSSVTHYLITFSGNVGTDGSRWEIMHEEKQKGIIHNVAFTATTEDVRSVRLNGGRVTMYSDCHMLTYTEAGANATGTGAKTFTATFYCPVDGKETLKHFLPVQGV